MCLPYEREPEKRYRPGLDPQALYGQARVKCKDTAGEDYATCISDAKLKILMSDPAIAKQCERRSDDLRRRCVDRAYLYGPDGRPPAKKLRIILGAKLQVIELVDRRDEHPAGSDAWRDINDELRRLDESLRADDIDLSDFFNRRGVFNRSAPTGSEAPPQGSAAASPPSEPRIPPTGTSVAPPNVESASVEKKDADPSTPPPEAKRTSARDEILCNYLAERIRSGAGAETNAQSFPPECQDDIASALAVRPNGPPILMDSADRAWIVDTIAEIESYGPPNPSPMVPRKR